MTRRRAGTWLGTGARTGIDTGAETRQG
jgi:hypothetical protein